MLNIEKSFMLVSHTSYGLAGPEISIVIPFFNRQEDLEVNLDQLVSVLTLPVELILINDSSEDESLRTLIEWQSARLDAFGTVVAITIYSSVSQQFETRCDHFGIEKSQSSFVLEVQADMFIEEFGFDARLLKAISSRGDLVAVSGRGCHKFEEIFDAFDSSMGAATFDDLNFATFFINRMRAFTKLFIRRRNFRFRAPSGPVSSEINRISHSKCIFPFLDSFQISGRAGKLGQLIDLSINTPKELSNVIWISDTVMRGPLLIDKTKYFELGGFDIHCFFLGYDEHDLFLRASFHGYRCGYVPIDFRSPLESGTSRTPRSLKTEWELTKSVLRVRRHRKNCAIIYARSRHSHMERFIVNF